MDNTVKGRVVSVGFTPERGDGLFELSLDDNTLHLVLGNEGKFTANGVSMTWPELMKWFAEDTKPIQAVLHPVLERYMSVLEAEFTR
jgi:hypothetical protein